MDPVVKLLREVVALPSVNPAFLPAGGPHTGEQRVAEFLAATAARQRLDVELRQVMPGRPNLYVTLSPSGQVQERLLLVAHLDTVGGSPLTAGLFDPRIKNGRLHGRGACDTKGSVVAMLFALGELARRGMRPRNTEIVFAGIIDEENNQEGSRAMAKSGLTASLAVVGEPTRLRVVTAHKGDMWLRLETQGKAAHGATPQYGRNAVHAMARVVDLLETTYREALTTRTHPLLGHPTVNVGVIEGGVQPNVVPAHSSILIDRRTLPGETEAGVVRELYRWLHKAGHKATIRNAKSAVCPPLETVANHPWIKHFFKLARQPGPQGVHYFCDAAVLASAGIPSMVFGPGDIAQAHTADEWISLRSLEKAVDLLIRFLETLP